jgi:DNA modification methylase
LNNPEIQGSFIDTLNDYISELQGELSENDTAMLDLRIKQLIGDIEDIKEGLTDDDAIPEPPKKPKTKMGDLYILGEHRLLCGDSTKQEDVKRLMDGHKADMVFTDPPYNVNYGANKTHPSHNIRKIQGDNLNKNDYEIFLSKTSDILKTICSRDIYFFMGSGPEGMKAALALINKGLHWSATIIWKKDRLILTPANYQRIYETCFYGWFEKSSYNGCRKNTELWQIKPKEISKDLNQVELCCREENLCPLSHIDIWEIKRPTTSLLHPTMKPVELILRALINSSKKNTIVLDLFLGSGSTMIACEKLNRRCFGMEIDPVYCDVIVKRWEDFTGKKAELLKGAKAEGT